MKRESGMSLIEVVLVLAIISIAVAIAAVNLRPLESPLDTATSLLEGFFREARLNAIATTSAYRVSPVSAGRLQAERAATCAATSWTLDDRLSLTLPTGIGMSPSAWSVCFSNRGISSANVSVTLTHATYGTRRVEVLVGGTSRVLK